MNRHLSPSERQGAPVAPAGVSRRIGILCDRHRFPSRRAAAVGYAYIPFGLPLALMRIITVLVVGLAARAVPVPVRRQFYRFAVFVVGLSVKFEGREHLLTARDMPTLAAYNHVCLYDAIVLALQEGSAFLAGDPNQNASRINGWIFRFLSVSFSLDTRIIGDRRSFVRMLKAWRTKAKDGPVVFFAPEGTVGSARALFQFEQGLFGIAVPVMPVVMSVRVPIEVSLHPICAHHGLNFLWPLMLPWTRVHVRFLAPMSRGERETPRAFADRVQHAIADALGVDATTCTRADKVRYRKALKHAARRR